MSKTIEMVGSLYYVNKEITLSRLLILLSAEMLRSLTAGCQETSECRKYLDELSDCISFLQAISKMDEEIDKGSSGVITKIKYITESAKWKDCMCNFIQYFKTQKDVTPTLHLVINQCITTAERLAINEINSTKFGTIIYTTKG